MINNMFLIDGPYVSKYLKQTLVDLNIQVVKTKEAITYLKGYHINYIDEREAVSVLNRKPQTNVYTNSENTIGWLYSELPQSELAQTVFSVKDKVLFRDKLKQLHPQFYYAAHQYIDLSSVDPAGIPFPVILKPSVGFFSLGVYKVENAEEWKRTIAELDQGVERSDGLYPKGVLDNSIFIIEEIIQGDEFAVDCYYDNAGSAVVLNISQHLFASSEDVNDRVYITSGPIIEKYLDRIQSYLNKLGEVFQLSTFPAHIELRIDNSGVINAIEINPLRFGGWCSTPDMCQYAWDMNIYEYVVKQLKPDWPTLIHNKREQVYALVVLDNSTGHRGSEIKSFNYDAFLERFSDPLELREADFKKHPLFGFFMCRVHEGQLEELYSILHSDLKEFIVLEN